MRQSPKNLFDTGGHDQYLLLVPYLNAVLDYTPKTSASGCDEFISFFISTLESSFSSREEYEHLPDWVFDIDSYRLNSEILMTCTLFMSILDRSVLPFGPDYSPDLTNFVPSSLHGVSPISDNPLLLFLLCSVLDHLMVVCEDRGWDASIFKSQIYVRLGLPSEEKILDLLFPLVLCDIDYN